MSSLWTPGGERPVGRDQAEAHTSSPAPPAGGRGAPAAGADEGMPELTEEEMRQQLDELREQLATTPPEVVIANHAFGLFELAALHLSLQPPQLPQARLAIDAFAALVEGLQGRLGEAEPQLEDGLAQLRLAFVQISAGATGGGAPGGGPDEPPA